MTLQLTVLQCGRCETLKASVHATALGLAAVMGIYNAAAWLSRRQKHLAVNAVLYTLITVWEQKHVAHHLAAIRQCRDASTTVPAPAGDSPVEAPPDVTLAA